MSKLTDQLQTCLLNLEAHHHKIDGWRPSDDATPSLYILYMFGGEIVARQVRVPENAWNRCDHPAEFLQSCAVILERRRDVVATTFPPDAVGVAFVAEMWRLTTLDDENLELVAMANELHRHPKRHEARGAFGALFMGSTCHAALRTRSHDGDDDVKVIDVVDGGVPQALRLLADTLVRIRMSATGWRWP